MTGETLLPALAEQAELKHTWLQTDGATGYKSVAPHVADHATVNHSAGVYVGPGAVGTNLAEGYFGL